MCGIFFSLGFDKLDPMVINSVSHRGPDGRGWYEFNSERQKVIIAHRRLSIIDLSEAGHQPMFSEDKRYCITYNGEIYNYLELRSELKKKGYIFNTKTDTEVLLKSYIHWGKECLNKFNGMFAFLIWDNQEKVAFIARDRFGIKPLYCYKYGGKIAFASEIKQFCYLPGFRAKLNKNTAYHIFTSKLIHNLKQTLFQDVYQILGGEYLELNSLTKKIEPKNWYDSFNIKEMKKKNSYYIQEFKEKFYDSIRLRLRSDIPVGACLSGGLDSSSIVSVVSSLSGKNADFKSFSACYKNDPLDESRYVDIVSNETNIENIKIYPQPDEFIQSWENIIFHHDAPLGGATVYAQNQVFKSAAELNYNVLLDGQGADEVFAGYHSLFGAYHNELFSSGNHIKFIKEIISSNTLHNYKYKTLLIRMLETSKPQLLKKILMIFKSENTYCPIFLNKEFYLDHNPDDELFLVQKQIEQNLSSPKSLNELCKQKIKLSLPTLLHCEDRNSMMYSVESRVPFLDYKLVELGLSLPAEAKIKNGVTKKIIRDSLSGVIPNKIRDRHDKIGFAVPEIKWFQDKKNQERLRSIFNETVYSFPNIFNKDIFLDSRFKNSNPQFFDYFSIIDFGFFAKKFNIIT